jgi:hypothetical protein
MLRKRASMKSINDAVRRSWDWRRKLIAGDSQRSKGAEGFCQANRALRLTNTYQV